METIYLRNNTVKKNKSKITSKRIAQQWGQESISFKKLFFQNFTDDKLKNVLLEKY